MQKSIKLMITLFAAALILWLLWAFWSLGQTVSLFITGLVGVITAVLVYSHVKQQPPLQMAETHILDSLPAHDYQGAVAVVCGQSQALFSTGQRHRETAQGWYIPVSSPTALVNTLQALAEQAPSLLNQLSILYVLLPEQIIQTEALAQEVFNWRRVIGESRARLSHNLPFWVSIYLTHPVNQAVVPDENKHQPWFTLLTHQHAFHAEQQGTTAQPYSVWSDSQRFSHEQALQNTLWFNTLLDWLNPIFIPMLTAAQTGAPVLVPSAWAVQWITLDSLPDNIWQQFIHSKTALSLTDKRQTCDLLPLPDVLPGRLHHDVRLSRSERLAGIIGLIFGLFLVGALCGSYQHNRQLILHIGEDATRFLKLPDSPLLPKQTTHQQLQQDAAELARWDREGIPTAYSLALYQGDHIRPYLQALLSGWTPPPLVPVMIQAPPKMVVLDSLALFDSSQYILKISATKVLVNVLVNIHARPGWLIVVSGYTDNTGNLEQNQKLSLKRAESVRDWMIETSDIDPTCFAVQGYGQGHPVADNDTTEGRARNRRVEIRLIPQVDACRVLSR